MKKDKILGTKDDELSAYKCIAEQKFIERELWWKSSLDSIDHGIITTTTDGYINYMNQLRK